MGVAAVCAVTVNATDQPVGKALTVQLEAFSLRASALLFSEQWPTAGNDAFAAVFLTLNGLIYGKPIEKGLAFLV